MAERIEPVTFQGIQPRCVTFKVSSFANRELVVSFDERGQLARVDATAGSSAAAAVTALANAATTFRDEYATTLGKMVDIDSNRQKLKLSELTARVDALKKQKEQLDTQLAMDSAATNYDLALKQQRLSTEASVLQAQFTLDAAEASHQQRLAIEQMKVEIEMVKREVELFKAKQEAAAQERR